MILDIDEKKVARENKLKTFYLIFSENKKIIQTSVYAGLQGPTFALVRVVRDD